MTTVGVALGGGGAKGLAHLPLLEVFDDLGIRPTRIAGTSVGAIVGTLYASGLSARQMRTEIDELTRTPRSLKEWFEAKRLPGWFDLIDIEFGRSSLFQIDKFLDEMEKVIGVSDFEQLQIPLEVVASDFWKRSQVVFGSGPIIPAVAASFALPGIFKPVVQGDRVLVDGGSVNPVPYDLLLEDCDVVVAIDVSGQRRPGEDLLPSYTETIFNTFQISAQAILAEKIRANPPTIFIKPEIEDVKVLDFHKADEVYAQTGEAREQLARELAAVLERSSG